MRTKPWRLGGCLVLPLLLVLASSCGGQVPTPTPVDRTVVGLEVVPADGVWFSNTGQQAQLFVVGWTAEGDVVPDPSVSWSSSSASVVRVAVDGVLTSAGVGVATVRARAGSVEAAVEVQVSVPVPVSVRVVEPSLEGQEVLVRTPFSEEVVSGDGLATLLVSVDRPTLISALADGGTVLYSVAHPAAAGPASMSSGSIGVDYVSTARALLTLHPFLLTSDPELSGLLAALLEGHEAVEGLAGVIHAHGGVGDGALLKDAVQSALFEAAFAVLSDLGDLVDTMGVEGFSAFPADGVARASTQVANFYAVLNSRSYDLRFDYFSGRVFPELHGGWSAPIGIGVDFALRMFRLDTTQYDHLPQMAEAARFDALGVPPGRRLIVLDGSSTALLPSNTLFKNLQLGHWVGVLLRRALGSQPASLPVGEDAAYLLVGSTSGWGWFDRTQVGWDHAWADQLPGVTDDLGRMHQVTNLRLVWAFVDAAVPLMDLPLESIDKVVLSSLGCFAPTVPVDPAANAFNHASNALACFIGALSAHSLDLSDDEAALVASMVSQAFMALGDALIAPASSGVVERQAVVEVSVFAMLAAINKVAKVGEAMHRLLDSMHHTPLQAAIIVRGNPPYRPDASPPPRVLPTAQLFVKPSPLVTPTTSVELDARASFDGNGGSIASFEFTSRSGERYTNSSGTVGLGRFPTVGSYEWCVRVTNDQGERSDEVCDDFEVVGPPPPDLPDLIIDDYSIGGAWLGTRNFGTYIIGHDKPLELHVAWRNAGTVAINGTTFHVGVVVRDSTGYQLVRMARDYNFAQVGGGEDQSFTLNPVSNRLPPGMYTVTLWVDMNNTVRESNELNNTRSFALRVDEPINYRPTADFTFTQDELTVSFADASTDPNGLADLVGWFWLFGDGNASAQRNPTHTYAGAGTYNVSLTVTDRGGLSHQRTRSVTVASTNLAPTADFAFDVDDLTVTFTDLSTDPNGADDIVAWLWSFGDSNYSQDQNPVHTYATAGTYTVALRVTDQGGLIGVRERAFAVGDVDPDAPPSITSFVASPSSITVGDSTTLMWSVTGTAPIMLTIDQGVGDVSGQTSVVVSPTSTTTYTLTASNDAGSDTSTASVTVQAAPEVAVSISPTSVTLAPSGTQSFTATVTGATDTSVTWSVTCGSVSGSGTTVTYTAPAAADDCEVTAASVADATKSATATVTVTTSGGDFEPAPSYISISNVSLGAASGGTRLVSFDIIWDESWRGPDRPSWVAAPDNWDAAWVFAKYRVSGGSWQHATLAPSGHVWPAGAEVDVPSDRVGAFVYRSSSGYGTFTANGVGLQWDYAADGVTAGASVEVRPFGIEMVYVPQGSFWLGSGGSSTGEFREGDTAYSAYLVTDQSAISIGGEPGMLNWTTWQYTGTPSGTTNPDFPSGYDAFYVMKRELTQGQYVDFLNTLTQTQADPRRKPYFDWGRFSIVGTTVGSYVATLPYVPMEHMLWYDAAAVADWAGLRPLTELEFEKAARGPLPPVYNEHAWGDLDTTCATGFVDAGTRYEAPVPAEANATCQFSMYGDDLGGPLRAGSFAAPGRSRFEAGAGFYGALDLSGNVWEITITVGEPEGRAFAATHGDGQLDENGLANVASWPDSSGVGAGLRGGSWAHPDHALRVSDRYAAVMSDVFAGWRGARSAP